MRRSATRRSPASSAPGDRGALAAAELLRVGEVEQPVVREAGVQHQVQQAALAYRGDAWQPLDAVAPAVRANAQQPAAPFGDQQVAVGEEGQRPRMLQSRHHGYHLEAVLAGSVGAGLGRHAVAGHEQREHEGHGGSRQRRPPGAPRRPLP